VSWLHSDSRPLAAAGLCIACVCLPQCLPAAHPSEKKKKEADQYSSVVTLQTEIDRPGMHCMRAFKGENYTSDSGNLPRISVDDHARPELALLFAQLHAMGNWEIMR